MNYLKKLLSASLVLSMVSMSSYVVEAASAASTLFVAPSTLPQFRLIPPSRLGRISDYFNAPSPDASHAPLVILIQDLHAHYGVQQNIAGLLEFLSKKLNPAEPVGVDVRALSRPTGQASPTPPSVLPFALAVEGASGPVDNRLMALFPDASIKERAGRYLMREGELTGAEYFAVMHGLPKAVTGIENKSYYEIHRELFRKTWTERESLVHALKSLQADINRLPRHVYKGTVKTLYRQIQQHEKGVISDTEHMRLLALEAKRRGFSLQTDFPVLNAYIANGHLTLSDALTAQTLRRETSNLLLHTQAEMSAVEQKNLSVLGKQSGSSEYYLYLRELIYQHKLFLMVPSELAQYMEFLYSSHTGEMNRILHETNELAFNLMQSSAQTKAERDLVLVEHDLDLLLRLSDLQATEEEVRDFAPRLPQFIALTKSLLRTSSVGRSMDLAAIRPLVSSSLDYYVMAILRNEPMVDNTLALIHSQNIPPALIRAKAQKSAARKVVDSRSEVGRPDTAVLVAGGFHTAAITQILQKKNISYIVITPNVVEITQADHALYIKRLNGHLLTEEEVLSSVPQIVKESGRLATAAEKTNAATLALATGAGLVADDIFFAVSFVLSRAGGHVVPTYADSKDQSVFSAWQRRHTAERFVPHSSLTILALTGLGILAAVAGALGFHHLGEVLTHSHLYTPAVAAGVHHALAAIRGHGSVIGASGSAAALPISLMSAAGYIPSGGRPLELPNHIQPSIRKRAEEDYHHLLSIFKIVSKGETEPELADWFQEQNLPFIVNKKKSDGFDSLPDVEKKEYVISNGMAQLLGYESIDQLLALDGRLIGTLPTRSADLNYPAFFEIRQSIFDQLYTIESLEDFSIDADRVFDRVNFAFFHLLGYEPDDKNNPLAAIESWQPRFNPFKKNVSKWVPRYFESAGTDAGHRPVVADETIDYSLQELEFKGLNGRKTTTGLPFKGPVWVLAEPQKISKRDPLLIKLWVTDEIIYAQRYLQRSEEGNHLSRHFQLLDHEPINISALYHSAADPEHAIPGGFNTPLYFPMPEAGMVNKKFELGTAADPGELSIKVVGTLRDDDRLEYPDDLMLNVELTVLPDSSRSLSGAQVFYDRSDDPLNSLALAYQPEYQAVAVSGHQTLNDMLNKPVESTSPSLGVSGQSIRSVDRPTVSSVLEISEIPAAAKPVQTADVAIVVPPVDAVKIAPVEPHSAVPAPKPTSPKMNKGQALNELAARLHKVNDTFDTKTNLFSAPFLETINVYVNLEEQINAAFNELKRQGPYGINAKKMQEAMNAAKQNSAGGGTVNSPAISLVAAVMFTGGIFGPSILSYLGVAAVFIWAVPKIFPVSKTFRRLKLPAYGALFVMAFAHIVHLDEWSVLRPFLTMLHANAGQGVSLAGGFTSLLAALPRGKPKKVKISDGYRGGYASGYFDGIISVQAGPYAQFNFQVDSAGLWVEYPAERLGGRVKELRLMDEVIGVGSDGNNRVARHIMGLSGRHFEITIVQKPGYPPHFFLEDVGSLNGTEVSWSEPIVSRPETSESENVLMPSAKKFDAVVKKVLPISDALEYLSWKRKPAEVLRKNAEAPTRGKSFFESRSVPHSVMEEMLTDGRAVAVQLYGEHGPVQFVRHPLMPWETASSSDVSGLQAVQIQVGGSTSRINLDSEIQAVTKLESTWNQICLLYAQYQIASKDPLITDEPLGAAFKALRTIRIGIQAVRQAPLDTTEDTEGLAVRIKTLQIEIQSTQKTLFSLRENLKSAINIASREKVLLSEKALKEIVQELLKRQEQGPLNSSIVTAAIGHILRQPGMPHNLQSVTPMEIERLKIALVQEISPYLSAAGENARISMVPTDPLYGIHTLLSGKIPSGVISSLGQESDSGTRASFKSLQTIREMAASGELQIVPIAHPASDQATKLVVATPAWSPKPDDVSGATIIRTPFYKNWLAGLETIIVLLPYTFLVNHFSLGHGPFVVRPLLAVGAGLVFQGAHLLQLIHTDEDGDPSTNALSNPVLSVTAGTVLAAVFIPGLSFQSQLILIGFATVFHYLVNHRWSFLRPSVRSLQKTVGNSALAEKDSTERADGSYLDSTPGAPLDSIARERVTLKQLQQTVFSTQA